MVVEGSPGALQLSAAHRIGRDERTGIPLGEQPALSTEVVSRSKSVFVVFHDMLERHAAGVDLHAGFLIWRVSVVVAA